MSWYVSKTCIIKIGTSVISTPDRKIDSDSMKHIVYQISELMAQGYSPILVSSGAVACGREILGEYSTRDHLNIRRYAAVGQPMLMHKYIEYFTEYNINVAQVLVNEEDLNEETQAASISQMIRCLLENKIVPIINGNDAITTRETGYTDDKGKILWDNDSLASLLAKLLKCQCLILASNIDGVYDDKGKIISVWDYNNPNNLGSIETNSYGRGGINAKIDASIGAAAAGVNTFIINGRSLNNILNTVVKVNNASAIFGTESQKGVMLGMTSIYDATYFPPHTLTVNDEFYEAKMVSDKIRLVSNEERNVWLYKFKCLLERNETIIVENNQHDIDKAEKRQINKSLIDRLKIKNKLRSLIDGIDVLISMDCVDKVIDSRNIPYAFDKHRSVKWSRRQVPLGLILVIFESRPDVLVQLLSLAIKTGNGMVLKGGSEASLTLKCLFDLFLQAIPNEFHKGFRLLNNRKEANDALTSKHFDLVIPRGSDSFIKWVRTKTTTAIIGHGSGICSMYIHNDVDILHPKNINMIVHSKMDYPAACNSLELLLIHDYHKQHIPQIVERLREQGVQIFQRSKIVEDIPVRYEIMEHSDNRLLIDIVPSCQEAIDIINKYGSNHTDVIITNSAKTKELFFRGVKSASSFANCSTRCADGYRMGMGCEVGINTQKSSWFRGPVGIEGLMTTQIVQECNI